MTSSTAEQAMKAVQGELDKLPADLQESGLAHTVLVLVENLAEASSRDVASIHREIRNTLSQLQEMAARTPDKDDPVERERENAQNGFASTNT